MKIAIFTDTFPPQINGVANVAYQSAVELSKLGHEVAVFTVAAGRKEKNVRVETDGFTVIRVPSFAAVVYPDSRFAIPVGLMSRVRKFEPDIIHTHTPFMLGWSAVFAAKSLKVPLVGTHHTFFNHYLKHIKLDNSWTNKASWRVTVGYYNRCDVILSPSRSLADEMQEHGAIRPVIVLHNPVDPKTWYPVATQGLRLKLKKKFGLPSPSLIYVGRVSYEKSLDEVLRAMKIAVRKNPDLFLVIVGDGPEREALQDLVVELQIEKNVRFAGYLRGKELLNTLQASDIFITASQTENMPLSVLEAEACGLSIIAVNALGLPEIVRHDLNGLLATPGNYRQLARLISELATQQARRQRLGVASRAYALAYAPKTLTRELLAIYQQAIMDHENLPLS